MLADDNSDAQKVSLISVTHLLAGGGAAVSWDAHPRAAAELNSAEINIIRAASLFLSFPVEPFHYSPQFVCPVAWQRDRMSFVGVDH